MATALKAVEKEINVAIKPPNIQTATFTLNGIAPYMQHRFWKKAELMQKHKEGSASKNKRNKEPRDFDKDCEESTYLTEDGGYGIPASAFRQAMISACRLVGFKMTIAKMSIFVVADSADKRDGTPLVKLNGTPRQTIMPAKNDNGGLDLRSRPQWDKWNVKLALRYDADQFDLTSVSNLLQRAGMQVGVGEGRPDSRDSAGMGFGLFEVE